ILYDDLVEEIRILQRNERESQKDNAALRRHNTRLKNEKGKILQEKAEILQEKTDIEIKEQNTRRLLNRQYELRDEKAQKWEKEKLRHRIMFEEQDKKHEADLQEEDETRKELLDQMTKLKQGIASSSRLDGQIADETFRETMSCTFVAIKDCFWGILRKKPFSINVKLAECHENLDKYVPDHRDNTKDDRLQLCISTVAGVLVDIVSWDTVFGWPHNERLEAATKFWKHMPEPHDPKLQRKIKQWLALTKEILTDSDQQSMECAEQFILDYALEESQRLLEGVTDMVLTDNVLAELSDAMSPFLQVFRLLQYQRCPYTFEMLPAADEDEWNRFDPTEMEGMFGEKTGLIKASLFPQLCRLEMGGQDDALSRTVVCKARVAVAPVNLDTDNDTDKETDFAETTEDIQASVTETINFPEELQRDVLERMRQADVEMTVSVDDMEDSLVDVNTATIVDTPVEEDIMVVSEEVTAEIEVEVEVEIESESGRVEGKVEESKPERVEIKVEEIEYEKIVQDSFDEEDEIEGMDLST
ncbi:hypothetical protein D6C98_10545, partial [Aureobasidium pullulans]